MTRMGRVLVCASTRGWRLLVELKGIFFIFAVSEAGPTSLSPFAFRLSRDSTKVHDEIPVELNESIAHLRYRPTT